MSERVRVGAAVLERDDDPRSTRSTLSRSNHDAHRETVEAAAARTASWRLIATCAAVPTARVFGVDFADVSRSCGRAGDDKRYGLEFLSRVTSTINTNVKLNSLMRAPLPPSSRCVAPTPGRCVPECALPVALAGMDVAKSIAVCVTAVSLVRCPVFCVLCSVLRESAC